LGALVWESELADLSHDPVKVSQALVLTAALADARATDSRLGLFSSSIVGEGETSSGPLIPEGG